MAFKFTSAMSKPDAAMYNQHSPRTSEEGTNPASNVTAGNARMPAPTVVPV
eukprot:CAMPEP_0118993496 /NCGR_PEP_ID=MMETSP1173-20130426/55180_1 /TAXON_ID=1034831 /ORGANISM="Rhizochromulina marina cf, Strain CCMP1243" /LENGTH=50 /DNA_ID=CAMNT_0006944741 /DNA_START=40 /DNA_END=189 /DNA_ORIENTATION=+